MLLISVQAWAWKLTPVADGFPMPVEAVVEPGTGALHVVEQEGRIRSWKNGKTATVLDWRKKVSFGGECGLLSLAFHPAYKTNGRYFVNYTARTPELNTYVSEFKRGSASERVLLKFRQPYSNHNGGQLAFDSKGHLYVGVGDGGLAGDPLRAGQDTSTILGKILRLDVDKGNPYTVPDDNPFAKGGGLKEVFAWGLRNPWRFSFDPKTGKLFAADVGQDAWEEIDIVEKGKNYGWSVREGKHCFRPSSGCPDKDLVDPIWEYPRSQGQSVTGGFVYRGKKLKALEGAYVFGDYASGKIWALRLDEAQTKVAKHELLVDSAVTISSFGLDADGEILVLDHEGGRVLRLDR
jgi:glucose/arabinose dehydrogenase